jgi:TolB protein
MLCCISLLGWLWACQPATESEQAAETAPATDSLRYPQETHLRNIRQLTFGGDNAEAYFSFDDRSLVLQRTHEASGIPCDQIFWADIPTSPEASFEMQRVSTGTGRTTCAYFLPGDSTVIFASTHAASEACPPAIDRSKVQKYVWPIYDSYELYVARKDGSNLRRLTDNDFYDAEATLSPQGDKIVFTSTRSGDLELYVMDLDGSNLIQVTDGLGYDGGAFFSPDGSKLIFRASRPQTEAAQQEYRELLAQGLVAPTDMELYVCNVDGSELRRITELGNANWAPFFHPSGEKVIFASNHASGGRTFNLFLVNLDGSSLEQITYDDTFDAFPMFSYDGSKLVFSSNRFNGGTRETNVFIADWVE